VRGIDDLLWYGGEIVRFLTTYRLLKVDFADKKAGMPVFGAICSVK